MRLLLFLKTVLLGLLISLMMGCSVYEPLRPAAPLLRAKGEAEVAVGGYLSGRLEGSAAYSPLNHLVLRAAGGMTVNQGESAGFRNRQFELGMGTYRQLPADWLIGGGGGYGRGEGNRAFTREGFGSNRDTTSYFDYAARYHTVFADAFLAHEGSWTTWGVAYRLSQVRFASLTNNGLPLPLRRMTRNEPMVFVRFGGWHKGKRWWQVQVATSLSWSSDYMAGRGAYLPQPLADTKEARVLTSVGLVVYPHLLARRAGE
ncbi:hypothetical protein [Hymenobacter psychrophilus]|uniref:Outer membrane protein beta-barrel domain-containing protein n=1 Tax=Hymenobacter psychrophilus TaxID=651662 RepID=A0A1H3ECT7_9BACT|nr:hypothetical protein [Hymenobacter psychrophilus]SDX76572.1 hypothetical protein SAMN04488069_10383 [Hymenobacter psychrophilus]